MRLLRRPNYCDLKNCGTSLLKALQNKCAFNFRRWFLLDACICEDFEPARTSRRAARLLQPALQIFNIILQR